MISLIVLPQSLSLLKKFDMTRAEVTTYKNYLEEIKSVLALDERDVNLWCDLIEMLCFTNPDKEIFREDIERDLEHFIDGGIQLAALKELAEQMGFTINNDHPFANAGADLNNDDAAISDLLDQLTNVWFKQLLLRKRIFGDFYPFKIAKDRSGISCKKYYRFNKRNKLYMYFLLASTRGGLPLNRQRRIEFDFEPIAFNAFKKLVPPKGKSYIMGKGSYTSEEFRRNKFNKFNLLADSLNSSIKVTENYFNPKDSGENGIDFISWLSFKDGLPNNKVIAGQATCTSDWKGKYYESSKNEFGAIIDTSKVGAYVNSLFIPYHFKLGHNWAYPTNVENKDFILFDRYRILNNLRVQDVRNNLLPRKILEAIS